MLFALTGGLAISTARAAETLTCLQILLLDRLALGFSHADIADQIYEGRTDGEFATDWRRSRVRRLLEAGHFLIKGGYRNILGEN